MTSILRLLTLWSVCCTMEIHMPCHPAKLLVPRGGIPYIAAIGQHQHHLWHLINPLQPMNRREYSQQWKTQGSDQLYKLEIKYKQLHKFWRFLSLLPSSLDLIIIICCLKSLQSQKSRANQFNLLIPQILVSTYFLKLKRCLLIVFPFIIFPRKHYHMEMVPPSYFYHNYILQRTSGGEGGSVGVG